MDLVAFALHVENKRPLLSLDVADQIVVVI
jgi:hypothetical protein